MNQVTGWARHGLKALAILVLGGAGAWALLVAKPPPEPQAMPVWLLPPLVDVALARPGPRSLSVRTQGSVRPLREIQLVSQVGGRVESVSPRFAEGGFFRGG